MSTGPYVIVNTCAGGAWVRRLASQHEWERLEFPTEEEALETRDAEMNRELDISAEEAVVMPLAQFLVEYGE